tara:strand:+ start:19267 stop:19488 length:222 start_codon:yes stop_codon:yes gene_type:complete
MHSKQIKRLWIIFITVLIILFFSDLLIDRKSYFKIDEVFAFPSIYGFLSCIFLIVISKVIGIFLKRKDDYYDK